MIKIDLDSVWLPEKEKVKVEGMIEIKGNKRNLEAEVYGIITSLEEQCPDVYDRVIERRILEISEGGD